MAVGSHVGTRNGYSSGLVDMYVRDGNVWASEGQVSVAQDSVQLTQLLLTFMDVRRRMCGPCNRVSWDRRTARITRPIRCILSMLRLLETDHGSE